LTIRVRVLFSAVITEFDAAYPTITEELKYLYADLKAVREVCIAIDSAQPK